MQKKERQGHYMKKYLLFDLDGTLTDPKVGITTCVQYALKSFGIEEPDLDKLEPFIGPPLKDSFKEFYNMDDTQAQAAVDKYRERFSDKGLFENEMYEGIPQLLSKAKERGYVLAVASSKPTVFVETILNHFGIRQFFDVVVGSELDGTRVNKDEVLRTTLIELSQDQPLQLDEVFMIGDRKFDVEGAQKIGVECVGVTYGYGSAEELRGAGADYVVRSVRELENFLMSRASGLKPAVSEEEEDLFANDLFGADEPAQEEAVEGQVESHLIEEDGYEAMLNRDKEEQARKEKKKGEKTLLIRRIVSLIFTIFTFILVKNVVVYLLSSFLVELEFLFPDDMVDKVFFYDEKGNITGCSAGAGTIISTLGFIGGLLINIKMSVGMIKKTAADRKPYHTKAEPIVNYILMAAAAIGAVLGLNILLELLGVTTSSDAYQAVQEQQYAAPFVIGIICYGLIIPVAEEMIFRGIIFNCLRRVMNLKIATLLSAVVFGVYHGNMVQGVYAFLMGLLLVYGYEYFGSFIAAAVIHVAANVIAYILGTAGTAAAGLVNWPACIICLALAAASLTLMSRQKKIFFVKEK